MENVRLLKPDIIPSTSMRISYAISNICSHSTSILEMLVGTRCKIPDRLRASIRLCFYHFDIKTIRGSSLYSSQVAMVNRLESYLVSVTSNSTNFIQTSTEYNTHFAVQYKYLLTTSLRLHSLLHFRQHCHSTCKALKAERERERGRERDKCTVHRRKI